MSVIPTTHAALYAWREAHADLLRSAGVQSPMDASTFSFAPGCVQDLRALREEMEQRRTADSMAANAARRALKDRLEEAQSRLATRIAEAEREADRRLGEELAYLKADEGKLV